MKKWNSAFNRISFPVMVMVVLATIFIFFIGGMSILSFEQTRQHLLSEWNNSIQYDENHLTQNLQLINQGLLLYDHSFDNSMKEQFVTFIDAYNRSEGDPYRMNLQVIKDGLSASIRNIIDLYVIDEKGIVVNSTYHSDIGLDFKKWPGVFEDITHIRLNDSFQADRAVYGFGSVNNTRKFAYHPTPDHQYLLEISYRLSGLADDRRNFSYAYIMRNFVNNTPHIRSLTLYDSMNRSIWSSQKTGKGSETAIITSVQRAFVEKSPVHIDDIANNSEVFYYFIDISDNSTVSGNMLDLVARIDYDTTFRQEHLESLKLYHSLIALISAILGLFIAYFLAYHLTLPVRRIIEDINRIANGDLDHRVSYSGSPEFSRLETSINLLITRVQDLISSLQEKEENLRKSKEKYQNLVEQLNEGIWIVDENEKTTFVNSRMAAMLESTPEELQGILVHDIIHPSYVSTLEIKLQNRHNGISERYEIVMVTRNGHFINVEISASPTFAEDGTYLGSYGVVTDITQRKENEQRIREYTIQLEDRTRELEVVRDELFRINEDLDRIVRDRTMEITRLLEQKNDFIMQLGHDLRTPLTPILGLIPRIAELNGEEQMQVIQIIQQNARHILNIANKSLKLARLNSLDYYPEYEVIHIADIIYSVLDIHRMDLHQAEITATAEVSPDVVLRADPILIQELIDNLISNAIKFSKPEGGIIRITVQTEGNILRMSVYDDGVGIPAEEQKKIFDEFYKTDPSRHDKTSTGLGLPICRKIVEKHNGELMVMSEGLNKGTTFVIILPIGMVFEGFPES